jgi:hypothetical protein
MTAPQPQTYAEAGMIPPRRLSLSQCEARADQAVVFHPELGMVELWRAAAFDKAKIHDKAYPTTPPDAYRAASRVHADALDATQRRIDEAVERAYPKPQDPELSRAVADLCDKIAAMSDRLAAVECDHEARNAAIMATITEEQQETKYQETEYQEAEDERPTDDGDIGAGNGDATRSQCPN